MKTKLKLPFGQDKQVALQRFKFVEDETLRENLAIYTQYLIFLYALSEEYEIPGDLLYSTYKDIIIHGAHIVEAVCLYTIKQVHSNKDKVFGYEWKSTGKYNAELTGEKNLRIKICEEEKVVKKYSQHMSFNEIIRACKRSKLFKNNTLAALEQIQKQRNKIHLGGLTTADNVYSKNEADNFFSQMTKIISECESLQL